MELRQLEALYPNVKNFHLLVELGQHRPRFMYTVREGCAEDEKFGIVLAEVSGFPPKVIEYAKDLRTRFDDIEKANTYNADHQATRTYYQLAMKLLSLRASPMMKDPEALRSYLVDLKSNFVLEDEETSLPCETPSKSPLVEDAAEEAGTMMLALRRDKGKEKVKEKEKGTGE